MPRRRLLPVALLALLPAMPAPASTGGGDALSEHVARHIPGGKWAFAYWRVGEFKPLLLRRREEGVSTTCIHSDPRRHLIDWVTRRGCQVQQEAALDGGYALSGECRLKWFRQHPIPVEVRIAWVDDRTFNLEIRTRNDPLLGYVEHTTATLQGDCEPSP